MNGSELKFNLLGVNNQNFIMADRQTGSFWQQISGQALRGELKGTQLDFIYHEEISFELFKNEFPDGRVLNLDSNEDHVFGRDWAERIQALPVVVELKNSDLPPRTLVLGVQIDGIARAWVFDDLIARSPVPDVVGDVPLLVVVAADKKSYRVFDRRLDGKTLDLYAKADSETLLLLEAESGSAFDFTGTAIDGPLAGKKLKRIQAVKDFLFNWRQYHPEASLFQMSE